MLTRNVFARGRRPTENALRDALADGLSRVQGSRTDQDAADMLGWSVGTVRNVRNRANTASVKIVSDAIDGGGAAFIDPLLALHGFRSVPLDASCDTDAGTHPKLAKMAVKIAEALDDGTITPHEAREMIPELQAWQAVMDRLGTLAALA